MITRTKYPFEYELKPDQIKVGGKWVNLILKNLSKKTMTRLEVKLYTLDSYLISVFGEGGYIPSLKPNEPNSHLFHITATGSSNLYVNIKGTQDGKEFCWDSSKIPLIVGEFNVKIMGVFALTSPRPLKNKKIAFETNLQAIKEEKDLHLEFWVEDPSCKTIKISEIEIKKLKANSITGYSAEMTPATTGLYTIYAYLYKGNHRIDLKTDNIWVTSDK